MFANAIELHHEIVAHPWEAIAIAFALGAYVAFDRTHTARRALLSSLGTSLVGTVRDVVERRIPRSPSWIANEWPTGT